MANEFYSDTGTPAAGSFGSSSAIRAEFASVEAGFDKLPTMTGNGGEMVAVNSGGTALEAITTTGTGSGVRATTPTLARPSFNGFARTMVVGNEASGSTITLLGGNAVYVSTGAATKAALTFQLPAGALLIDGLTVRVMCVGAVTALTVSTTDGSSLVGNPTTLAAGGFFEMQYRENNTTWYRVG